MTPELQKSLGDLGGTVERQVRGIELSQATCRQTEAMLDAHHPKPVLTQGDFFDQSPASLGLVTAVVGNPPFIRYQSFSGATRRKALNRALDAGVKLSDPVTVAKAMKLAVEEGRRRYLLQAGADRR